MVFSERRISSVPLSVSVLFAICLLMQAGWHIWQDEPQQQLLTLSPPPDEGLIDIFVLGDPIAGSRLIMLWLQNFDNQSGQFLSYNELDYGILIAWLKTVMTLDKNSKYPLFAASYLYAHVADPDRQRQMLEFIYKSYLEQPQQRWRWLAHAAVIAKHRLSDLPLAFKYAEEISKNMTNDMPAWARQMHIFILEDMGELERARLLIGGLLATNELQDDNEIQFLTQRLQRLEQQLQQ